MEAKNRDSSMAYLDSLIFLYFRIIFFVKVEIFKLVKVILE